MSARTGSMKRHGRPHSHGRPRREIEDVTTEQQEFGWFVGIDWATQQHQANVGDAAGHEIGERIVKHSAQGLIDFVDWLTELSGGQLHRVAISIETTRGALVETLMERGAALFSINPKQLDRFRDRFSVAGAKDDRLDARVLRSALRTDQHLFRRLTIDESRVIQVRELTRAQEELSDEFGRLTNRLREQVYRMAPAWLTVCEDASDPWFWALVELAKTPADGRSLRPKAVALLLREYRIRRVSPEQVLAAFTAPPMYVAPGTVEAVTTHIALLLPRLRLVAKQQRQCDQELETLLTALAPPAAASSPPSDGAGSAMSGSADALEPTPTEPPNTVAIIRSAPGVGLKITGALVAHALLMLTDADLRALRCSAGTAPVTRRTGKQKKGTVSMRYACHAPLREALFHWAQCSIRARGGDQAAREYYTRLRAKGHSHARALRSVGDRWLRILVSMLKSRTLYDPTRFAVASN